MTAPRTGIVLSGFGGLPLGDFLEVARETEARGYDTAWLGEVSGADAVTLATLVLGATGRLRAGTGVVPVQTRTPVLLGLTAASLDRMAGSRFTLGLGLSSRVIVEQWHGRHFSPSLAQLREAVQIIRLVTAGERVTFEGRFYRVRNFRMTAPPPTAPPRIVLAALGPEMLELAGEIADGVLLNWIAPETVPQSMKHLETGARRAGRTLAGFEVAAFIRTCVTDDPEAGDRALARDLTGYAVIDTYASFFRATGFGAEVDAVNAAWNAGDRAGAVRHISPRLLETLGVVGPAPACRDRIAEFARAGVTMPVILPFPPAGADVDAQAGLRRTLRAFP
ncbi:MAG: LLM class F420-dependent oxidoreductase [Candidatus Rokubacteria bacterium]|nr:LLM class F420-dependent oxidoreductase [Candidatus Rokubacteria bacterium]